MTEYTIVIEGYDSGLVSKAVEQNFEDIIPQTDVSVNVLVEDK